MYLKMAKRVLLETDKKLVWKHTDDKKFGIHHFQILDTNGKALTGRPLR